MADSTPIPDLTNNYNISNFSLSPSYFTFAGAGVVPDYDGESIIDGHEVDFLSQTRQFDKPSSSDDSEYVLDILYKRQNEVNIKTAFSMAAKPSFNGLIQFWSPLQSSSRHVLTTSDQPFMLQSSLEKHKVYLKKHRSCSEEYQYNIAADQLEVEEDPTIISGAPANAFRSKLAEVVPNLRVQAGSPLVYSALECELMSYFVLPISSQSQSQCVVGVVECCTKDFDCLLEMLGYLVDALKIMGLSTFHTEGLLCQTKDGLRCTMDDMVEIEAALKTACISHELTLAQVSIAYEDTNDMPNSSSLEGKHMTQMMAHKMIGRCPDSDDYDFKDYCGTCDMLPSKIGEGLVGKANENYMPHFCRNIYVMNNKELPTLIETITIKKYSCLVICLRSTMNDVYVIEFLWLQNRKYTVLIESLVLTLKRCLPNFKFAFGGELGDELLVVEVGNSSTAESGSFKIFKGVKLSQIHEMMEKEREYVAEQCIAPPQEKGNTSRHLLTKELIEQQYGKPQKEAAEILNVSLSTLKRERKDLGLGDWVGSKGVKRKANRSYKDQSNMINKEDNRELLRPVPHNGATLTIKAYYQGTPIKFRLPLLRVKFKYVQKKIGNKLKLDPGSFKLMYKDDEDDEYILLVSDEDITDCIESSTNVNRTTIKLYVQYPI